MKRIDSHQHFWKFDPVRDSWIDESMRTIQRDFFPEHLKPILDAHHLDGCVAVQADQSETETEFLLELSQKNDFIKGVVGWLDLTADNLTQRLTHYSQFKHLKGLRHVLQGETDRALMLSDKFMKGIAVLKPFDLTYDILIYPDQLGYTHEFVKAFPNQRFVIDHIAKPDIKNKTIEQWRKGIKAIAKHENVYCKASGMVTEADWKGWQLADFDPYLDVVFNGFGFKRMMFGSDWPVCNVAGGYDGAIDVANSWVSKLSDHEQSLFWGLNAIEFYKLG